MYSSINENTLVMDTQVNQKALDHHVYSFEDDDAFSSSKVFSKARVKKIPRSSSSQMLSGISSLDAGRTFPMSFIKHTGSASCVDMQSLQACSSREVGDAEEPVAEQSCSGSNAQGSGGASYKAYAAHLLSVKRAECLVSLPPEVEEGKIEYKLKLISPSSSRFEHLVTQMKWRLQEGAGEAIYEIGVEDCGTCIGLKNNELEASMITLRKMAERLGATLTVLRDIAVGENRKAREILVRKVPDDQQFLELRIAVLGNVECGKSTLVGVLTHGEYDNGQGRARLNLFRHLHEVQSGRTSSISQEIIGYDSDGKLLNYSGNKTTEDICEHSSKIIRFIDVPGHHKYVKTTIFGLMGHSPHFAMLVMSANSGIAGTTREQLGFALCLGVPLLVVVTKIDSCRASVLEKNLRQLEALLKAPGARKIPTRINDVSDAVTAATRLNGECVVPIFRLSSITGEGLELLERFLNVLPPTASAKELDRLADQSPEFQVDDVFMDVPDVGLVTSGTMKKGCIKEDEVLLAGPLSDARFMEVRVTSIHRNRFPCRMVRAGHAAALALSSVHGDPLLMRRGMVLVSTKLKPTACYDFEADINLLFHPQTLNLPFRCTVHIGSVCQMAEITKIEKDKLKTTEHALVKLKFLKQPESIAVQSKLLFRHGLTRGIGTVTKVEPFSSTTIWESSDIPR